MLIDDPYLNITEIQVKIKNLYEIHYCFGFYL